MLLAIDIGNTDIVLAIHNGNQWQHIFRHETKIGQPTVYFESALRNLLLEWDIQPLDIKGSAISCVVPEILHPIHTAIDHVLNQPPVVLNAEVFAQLDLHIPLMYEIGADIVSNAFAAMELYGKSCIIVDFGTTLTFVVVTPSEGIKGVSIAPGLFTALQSLSQSTALLPQVDFDFPTTFIGQNTKSAIQCGVFHGYVGMIRYMLQGIEEECAVPMIKVATGGLSQRLSPLSDAFDEFNRHLTLDGIRLIYNKLAI
jgi:type III pantothenate kinase